MPSLDILVTNGDCKHSISLMKNIKKHYRHANIYAHLSGEVGRHFLPSSKICQPLSGDLEEILKTKDFDVVIPVSGISVKTVATGSSGKALLPPISLINLAFDKSGLASWVEQYGFNYPKTVKLDFENLPKDMFPCIVKSANEVAAKIETLYIENSSQLGRLKEKLSGLHQCDAEFIIQERIQGSARGYFAICEEGRLVCEFMHERVRQLPHTGGSSTAAKSFFDDALGGQCREFLKKVKWSGPIMIEFLYDHEREKYYLIEINPKFWGSLDLAHQAGVDFGVALVSTMLKDKAYTAQTWKPTLVLWPLDGDFVSIFRSGKIFALLQYFGMDAKIILGENIKSVLLKLLWSIKKIVTGK